MMHGRALGAGNWDASSAALFLKSKVKALGFESYRRDLAANDFVLPF
jgi:hypothetical protein